MVTEFAPFGVVGADHARSPTRPSTIINNTIAIVSAGNAVVFNAHPSARRVLGGDGPAHQPGDRRRRRARRTWSTAVAEPTIETARALMNHPGRPRPARHRRPGRRARGAQDRQAGDHRRPRQPAGRRRRDRRRRAGRRATSSAAPRSTTTSSAPTRRSSSSVDVGRRPARPGDGPERRLRAQGARAAPAGAGDLHGARRSPGSPAHINPAWIGQDAARILAEIGVQAEPSSRGCWSPRCRATTAWSGPSR